MRATSPGIPRTGNKLEMTATVIHRIEDGKLAELTRTDSRLVTLTVLDTRQR